MPGALVNGAATSDRTSIPAGAGINSLSTSTYIGWFFPTTLGTNLGWFVKAAGRYLIADGTDNTRLQYGAPRATTATNYNCATGAITLNTWQCFAATFDIGATAGNVVKFYRGTLSSAMAALGAGGTNTDGAGALTSDAATNQLIGNYTNLTSAFKGSIGPVAVFGSVLSLADMRSWQLRPRLTLTSGVAGMFARPGKNGADMIEYAGLGNGTVTGSTQGNGPGFDQGELQWSRDTGLLTMAA